MMKYLQKLGKSLMLPVAVLPAAAILMGIGYAIDPAGWGGGSPIAAFLIKSGSAIIDHLPILFAVGVSLGMSKDKDGASALSGLVAYLVVTTLLSSATVAMLQGIPVEEVAPAFGKIENAFIGIISGLVGAGCYNRFSHVQLPQAFAFFSGKRLAPIMSSVAMIIVSGILFFIWPVVYGGLVAFGESIIGLGPVGAGIYAFFNRLLIPTGLHHALNSVFWFDVAGINDIGKFWGTVAGGVKGVTGMYQAGFFPVMMFGLPAAGLAMYKSAKPEKKKVVASLMLAAGFAAFLTGVTEPLEFAFMFVAPGLYLVHAILTGIMVFIAAQFQWIAGFGFSAGLVDYLLSIKMPLANNIFMLIPLGLVCGVIYYALFRFLIVKFNLKTPGREDDDVSDEEMHVSLANNNFKEVAQVILEGLGGKDNIVSIDNCITRLRLEVKDSTIINDKKIKTTGAAGIIKPSKTSAQVIVGTQVQFVAEALSELVK
ncbi:N-acetylglucosamine-specific PTS transporter subunit IIBC [Clostridium cadaveris]|uniref:N-acetylglucosamine-specific PTS transporter subunit IIBC n=1 Tax=Clostridium cadaveris TaxID=1529 RepID=UPI001E2E8F41|nr:N-acetylglucosamine-specific PTS transporter subunit IIBC [Clostridium cadaveris]UFH65683.1 N-acetylglucosamine-specific PTS transporter subunit IIBC [Clostridium cadaveris]